LGAFGKGGGGEKIDGARRKRILTQRLNIGNNGRAIARWYCRNKSGIQQALLAEQKISS